MRSARASKSSQAFTLVELLVVIGIIAVLISLLFPALARVREHANRIKCAANLRSIGQALTMYTQQYGYYPCAEVLSHRGDFALWTVRVRVFLGGDRRVFRCPSQDDRFEWTLVPSPQCRPAGDEEMVFGYERGESVIGLDSFFSYGYNAWGSVNYDNDQFGLGGHLNLWNKKDPTAGELRASRVRVPSEMIAIADATADGFGDFGIFSGPDSPRVWPGTIHSNGGNLLFCDGHVQWYLQKDVVIPYWAHPRRDVVKLMWNNDHTIGN